MSCPHRETTTIAWLSGEGPEEHVHHVALCPECQEVVDEMERVEATIANVRTALRHKSARPWVQRRLAVVALLLAASALVVWRVDRGSLVPAPDVRADLVDAGFDDDLEDLESDLDWLFVELDVL